jgi:hypothetical protein
LLCLQTPHEPAGISGLARNAKSTRGKVVVHQVVAGDLKVGQNGRCGTPPWNTVVFFKNLSK